MPDLLRFLDTVGIDPPPELVKLRACQEAINTAIADDPAVDLRDVVLSGKADPKKIAGQVAEAAAQLVYAGKLRDVNRDLQPAFVRAERMTIQKCADNLLEQVRAPFNDAVAALKSTTSYLGADPDPASIGRAGPQSAALFEEQNAACQRLEAVRRIRQELGRQGYGENNERVSWWLASAKNAGALEYAASLYFSTGAHRWERLVVAGIDLRVNTADEATAIEELARKVSDDAEKAANTELHAVHNARMEKTLEAWRAPAGKAS